MERKIIAVLTISLSIFIAGAAFAGVENDLIENCQSKITDCMQKISLLEKKIEALQAPSQKKTVVIHAQKDSIDPSSPWWWERWGEDEPDY